MACPETACRIAPAATAALVAWARQVGATQSSPLVGAQALATRLEVHLVDGHAEVGCWAPELSKMEIPPERVFLEIFTPLDAPDLNLPVQTGRFRREQLQLRQEGHYLWGVVAGMQPGRREQLGSL